MCVIVYSPVRELLVCAWTGPSWSRQVWTHLDTPRFVQIRPNTSRYAQIDLDTPRLTKTCPDATENDPAFQTTLRSSKQNREWITDHNHGSLISVSWNEAVTGLSHCSLVCLCVSLLCLSICSLICPTANKYHGVSSFVRVLAPRDVSSLSNACPRNRCGRFGAGTDWRACTTYTVIGDTAQMVMLHHELYLHFIE